jgi:tetratricopeptide (TPR) repeat protein
MVSSKNAGMKDKYIPAIVRSKRQLGWLACLLCLIILAIGAIKPAREASGQAMGLRRLLVAEASLPEEVLVNPFVCLKAGGTSGMADGIKLNDTYLQGVSLCLAGDQEAGLKALELAGKASGADIQYAAGMSVIDTLAGANMLREAGLSGRELVAVVQKLIAQPDVDRFPLIRLLAEKASDQTLTWSLWLQASSLLEAGGDGQAALDWINEGLTISPGEFQSSFLLRKGRIYQTRVEPKDYQSAIEFYSQAMEVDRWINPAEEATAHLYLAEIYKTQKDSYTSEQVLSEYQAALMVSPNNYSALLYIGHLYLNDIKDLDQAEAYYRRALDSNPQNPNAYLYLGDVYRERGDRQIAEYWYRQALVYKPDWKPAIDRLDALEGK